MFKRIMPIISAVMVLLFFLIRCQIKNPTENLKLIVNFSPISTVVAVDVINPQTQGYVTKTVKIRIEGQDKLSVVDVTGKAIQTVSTNTGIASFAITDDVTPTIAQPVKLLLIVEADGYIKTSKPVTVQNTERQSVTVNLVEIQNLPDGVSGGNSNTGNTNPTTGTTAPIVVETVPETLTDVTAQVDIDPNTVIYDAGGQALSGQLSTSVVYFDGESTESLESFPGGFTVNVPNNPEGEDDGTFITAGFVAVEIQDQNGNQAETFSQPVTITMELGDGVINPSTGQPVVLGDVIPIWSYDEETGQWSYEADGTVQGPNANGKLYVEYQASHLSYWNLDWFWNNCYQSRKIIFDGWLAEYGDLYLVLYGNGFWHDAYISGDNWIILYYAPNFPLNIKAYAGGPGGVFLGEWTGQMLCGSGELTLPVQVPDAIKNKTGSRVFHITGICQNQQDIEVRPTAPIWYRLVSSSSWKYAGLLKDGVLTINGLVFGQSYVFATSYENEWYESAFEIGSDFTDLVPEYADKIHLEKIEGNHIYYSVDLPNDVCDKLNN